MEIIEWPLPQYLLDNTLELSRPGYIIIVDELFAKYILKMAFAIFLGACECHVFGF